MTPLKFVAGCLLSLMLPMAGAADQPDQPDRPGMMPSTDGLFVVDTKARQVWSRCLEGTQWDGHACAGTPHLATYAEALSLASARSKKDGLRWRVPRVKELQRLTSKAARTRQQGQAPVFPATPGDWLWTESANIDTRRVNQYQYSSIERGVTPHNANNLAFLHGWAVNTQTGEARGDVLKRSKLPVRLVRADD